MAKKIAQYLYPFQVHCAVPNREGGITQSQGFETEEAAKSYAATHVAQAKGGIAVVYEAKHIAQLPTPVVDWAKPDTTESK